MLTPNDTHNTCSFLIPVFSLHYKRGLIFAVKQCQEGEFWSFHVLRWDFCQACFSAEVVGFFSGLQSFFAELYFLLRNLKKEECQ